MTGTDVDPSELALDDLRSLRNALQNEDDAISYVRRLTQAKLDLVRAERVRRVHGDVDSITQELPVILATHLTGGPPRPPRPADDFSGHQLAVQLDELDQRLGGADIGALSDDELDALAVELHDFERARSAERRDVFIRLDALSAELVRRYRDGEADVVELLANDD